SLWVGQNDHGWAGHRGIQRITYTGKTPMEVQRIHLNTTGFDLTFTLPLNPDSVMDKKHFKVRHYNYHYSAHYRSDLFNVKEVPVTSIHLSEDHKTISLKMDSIQAGMIYEFTLSDIKSEDGQLLRNNPICYTVNQ